MPEPKASGFSEQVALFNVSDVDPKTETLFQKFWNMKQDEGGLEVYPSHLHYEVMGSSLSFIPKSRISVNI